MGITVKIEGLDQLKAKLTGIKSGISADLEQAGIKGMLVLEAEIKRRAPVKTGNLMNSYTTEAETSGDTTTVTTGTNVIYGPAMEYGPRPHVRPALDATEGDISAVVVAELKKAIERSV